MLWLKFHSSVRLLWHAVGHHEVILHFLHAGYYCNTVGTSHHFLFSLFWCRCFLLAKSQSGLQSFIFFFFFATSCCWPAPTHCWLTHTVTGRWPLVQTSRYKKKWQRHKYMKHTHKHTLTHAESLEAQPIFLLVFSAKYYLFWIFWRIL